MKLSGDETVIPYGEYGYISEDQPSALLQQHRGVAIRTELAARAMQGILSGAFSSIKMYKAISEMAKEGNCNSVSHWIAQQSLIVADAMIGELNITEEESK